VTKLHLRRLALILLVILILLLILIRCADQKTNPFITMFANDGADLQVCNKYKFQRHSSLLAQQVIFNSSLTDPVNTSQQV
jgi:hypothetical protein